MRLTPTTRRQRLPRRSRRASLQNVIQAAAADETDLITINAEVTIAAAASDGSKGPRKFAVNAYNGGPLELPNFDLPVVIDLAGMSRAKSIVANLYHDKKLIVGHAEEVQNDGKTLHLGGVVSGAGPSAGEVLASHDNGFPWQTSVEAKVLKQVRVPVGKSVNANGQTFHGPIIIARKSRLHGFAFVPHGADDSTSVKIAASADHSKEHDMKFEQWIEAMGLDFAELNDKQKAALKKKFDAEIAAQASDKDDKATSATDIEAEAFDLADIKAAANDFAAELDEKIADREDEITDKKALATIKASARKAVKELKAKAISEKWTTTRFEIEAIKASSDVEVALVRAERPAGPAIHASSRDVNNHVIEAAMFQAMRVPGHEKHFDEKTLQAAHKQFKGRLGLQQLIIHAAAHNGMSFAPGERLTTSNTKRALRAAYRVADDCEDIEAANAIGVISLPGIFGNAGNKELLIGYMEFDETWREIAVVRSSNDYKDTTCYRLLEDAEYEELAPGGHMKEGKFGEESYTRNVKDYAKIFGLTNVDIRNDDLGAFDDLRTRIGRGGKKKFVKVFWTAFLDNAAFFTAGRGNYITGATTTLLTDNVGLQLGINAFDALRSPAADGSKKIGDRVGGQASILLVPPELHANADVIYKNTNLGTVANSSANIHAGKYRPVKVTQLSDSNYTGYSATAWYLLRPKEDLPGMVVSFLDGVEQPIVESADADFDQLGILFRGRHAFGAHKAEYLCGVKSKGAA